MYATEEDIAEGKTLDFPGPSRERGRAAATNGMSMVRYASSNAHAPGQADVGYSRRYSESSKRPGRIPIRNNRRIEESSD